MWKLCMPDCIWIWKFIHKWRLTLMSPDSYPTQEVDQFCPTCLREPESLNIYWGVQPQHAWPYDKIQDPTDNFLSQVQPRSKLVPNMVAWTYTPRQYIRTWNTSLCTWISAHFKSQQQIRWKQLYYRWVSKQWTHYLTTHCPDLDHIQTLTQIFLELWAWHNGDQHHSIECFHWIWCPIIRDTP